MKLADGFPLNTLGVAHSFLTRYLQEGGFCIDATAGRGRDTALLCSLVGKSGRVLAFDIQPEAVKATRALLAEKGYGDMAQVVLDSHSNMSGYAPDESADCVVFNLGWLPGGDHSVFTTSATSIPAIEQGLDILKHGGVMSICIYYGGQSGYTERDALLDYLSTLDDSKYTVIISRFANRKGDPPIPVFIFKE